MAKRILFVEDNRYHRLMVEGFLEKEGHTILSLADGENFLAALETFKPDLILLELNLPKIDGYTLLQQLRLSPWRRIPVIVISVYAFEYEKKKAFDLGVSYYLTKPTKLEAISLAMKLEPPLQIGESCEIRDFPVG